MPIVTLLPLKIQRQAIERTAAKHTGVEDSAVEARVRATLNGRRLLAGVNVL